MRRTSQVAITISVVAIAVLAILGSDVTTILGNVTSAMESAI